MADTSSFPLDWEFCVIFQFFTFDQNKGKYLMVKGVLEKEKCFHQLKLEWVFDQFIHLKQFNDSCNGYLVEDTCVFGAEVFVTKDTSRGKGQCLSMITDTQSFKHVRKIENFSKLNAESCDSDVFDAGGQKSYWRYDLLIRLLIFYQYRSTVIVFYVDCCKKIVLYPKGSPRGGDHVSLFLALADLPAITPVSNIYAESINGNAKSRGFSPWNNPLDVAFISTGHAAVELCVVIQKKEHQPSKKERGSLISYENHIHITFYSLIHI